jgi:hypothetical protein
VEEERRAKTPVFLRGVDFGMSAAAISAVGIYDGALRRGSDRYDELICAGENPLTTPVVLFDVPLTESDDAGCAEVEDVTGVSSIVGVFGARASWVWGSMCVGRGEMPRLRGLRSFFSLIVETIFSRSSGVICLSRPRLRPLAEYCLRI